MTAQLIDGKSIAASLRQQIAKRVAERRQQGLRTPGLAVILVGSDPASQVYVSHKRKDCEEVGFLSQAYDLPSETTQEALTDLIDRLNDDPAIDGVLQQASAMLSGLSHAAGLVIAPKLNVAIRHIEFVSLAADRARLAAPQQEERRATLQAAVSLVPREPRPAVECLRKAMALPPPSNLTAEFPRASHESPADTATARQQRRQ